VSERRLERNIRVRYGALPDVLLYRNAAGFDAATGTRYGLIKGASDLIGIGPRGRMLAVEVKMPGGTITEEQQLFLDLVEERGGIAVCATSPEDVEEAVNAARESRVYKWREQVSQVRGLRREGDEAPRRVRKAPK
jgi:hypothetical protein